jgi:hypothetical protein
LAAKQRRLAVKNTTRLDRILTVSCFLVALLGFSLAGTGTADAYCNWTFNCSGNPTVCTISNYFCANFSGDCDNMCDDELAECIDECQTLGGHNCPSTCGVVWARCVAACVPWL